MKLLDKTENHCRFIFENNCEKTNDKKFDALYHPIS